MFILTHARLKLLSQRCLPLTIWRYDSRDIHNQYRSTNQHQQPADETIRGDKQLSTSTTGSCLNSQTLHQSHQDHLNDTMRQQSTYYKTYGICKLKEYNTPKLHQRRNPILDRILVKELIKAELVDVLIRKFNPIRATGFVKELLLDNSVDRLLITTSTISRGLRDLYLHSSKGVRYLISGSRENYCCLFVKSKIVSRSTYCSVDSNLLQKFYSDNSKEDKGHNNDKYSYEGRSLLTLFSLLGLFRGMNASDIEEEKAKLTDEQKMKKMKPVELLIAKGVLAMCDQEYSKASDLFHQALHLAQDENDEERETLILNLLASNFFESGDLSNAEKLFIDLIKRMIAHDVEPTDTAILELSLKLASIYSKDRQTHEKAFKGFKFVISTLLSHLQDLLNNVEEIEIHELSEDKRDELALLGWSYDWFAKHLIAVNDFTGATDMLRKALEISTKVLGPLHDQTLILLNDVGTTMAMNNAPAEGKTFIKKAVEGAIKSQSKELASFYVNLGLVNLKLKNLSEARRYCEYSIELSLKHREHHNSQEVIMLSKRCLNEVQRLLEIDNQ